VRAVARALGLVVVLFVATAAGASAVGDLPAVVQTVKPARLVVPSLGVNAPVAVLGLEEDGAMPSPAGPDAVGWYDFSPTPGNAGNTVFSGHRDWRSGVTGVFWRLGELVPGDRIAVVLADGRSVDYEVLLSVLTGPSEMPIEEVVGQTELELITLITCEGSFNPATREYDRRRIVWALRAPTEP
jgi:LPXTG-site transpeptidase (sortase) family protein